MTFLANDPHVGAGAEDDVFAFEPGHLRQAQTCLDSQQHEGVITPARPCALIGCRKQAVNFGAREEWDQGPREALAGDGKHPLNLCGMSRCLESGETKERANRRQAQIATASADALPLLQMLQERHDQRRVDLLEGQQRRCLM